MLWGWRAEPGHSIGHRHLQRVYARSARPLLLVHVLHLRAQQRFHVFCPCAVLTSLKSERCPHGTRDAWLMSGSL